METSNSTNTSSELFNLVVVKLLLPSLAPIALRFGMLCESGGCRKVAETSCAFELLVTVSGGSEVLNEGRNGLETLPRELSVWYTFQTSSENLLATLVWTLVLSR
jgi:hypothetical protein